MKIRPIDLKKAQEIEKWVIKRAERKLKRTKISLRISKENSAPKEAIEKLQKRYNEEKRKIKEIKENPITEKDL